MWVSESHWNLYPTSSLLDATSRYLFICDAACRIRFAIVKGRLGLHCLLSFLPSLFSNIPIEKLDVGLKQASSVCVSLSLSQKHKSVQT